MSTHFIIVDAALEDDPPLDPGIPPTTLAELPITIARVGPSPENGLFAVSGADVFVQKADGTAVSIWADPTGLVPLVSPLPAINGRVTGWVARGQHLRARPVLPGNIAAATDWEYFWSSGVPGAAGRAAGPAGAPGPPGGPVAPTLILADAYLAQVPGTYANNTLAIEAAMAATPTYGGTVLLPPGIISMVGELTFPAKKIKLQGAGEDATYLYWGADTVAGTCAIARTDGIKHELCGLTAQGPTDAVIDGASASMWGVQHYSRNVIEDCRIQGFKAGVVMAGDHSRMSRVRVAANVDNIYYLNPTQSGVATNGNNYMTDVDATGAGRSCIAFAPGAVVDSAGWENMHFGLAPAALLWEVDGSNTAAAVTRIDMRSCSFENVGNGLFYSLSTTQAGVFAATFTQCTFSQGQYTFYDSAALRAQRAHLDGLASTNITSIDSNLFGFLAGPVPTYLQYGGYSSIDLQYGSIGAAGEVADSLGGRMLGLPLDYTLVDQVFRGRVGNRVARTEYVNAGSVIANQPVMRSGGGISAWTAGNAVVGIALQAGATLDFVLVGISGEHPVLNSAAVGAGVAVVPDAATPTKVTPAGAAPTMALGHAMSAGAGASSTVTVDVVPSGWRY